MNVEPIGLAARARELAVSGDFQYVYEIERRLHAEGCGSADRTFRGDPGIKSELRALIAANWRNPHPTRMLARADKVRNDIIRLNEAARDRQAKRG